MSDITINITDEPESGDPNRPFDIELQDGAFGLDDIGIVLPGGVTIIVNFDQMIALHAKLGEWVGVENEDDTVSIKP